MLKASFPRENGPEVLPLAVFGADLVRSLRRSLGRFGLGTFYSQPFEGTPLPIIAREDALSQKGGPKGLHPKGPFGPPFALCLNCHRQASRAEIVNRVGVLRAGVKNLVNIDAGKCEADTGKIVHCVHIIIAD